MEGSIEFLTRTTTVEAPFLYHKPLAAAGAEAAGAGAGVEMDGEGVSLRA